MLTLTDGAAVMAAINDPTLDPQLRALLGARARQLEDDSEPDVELGELAHFHAVQPGDSLETVEQALDMTMGEHPPWEWIEHHDSYFEAAFVTGDDGFGHILFVPDRADTDASLLAVCKDHLTTA